MRDLRIDLGIAERDARSRQRRRHEAALDVLLAVVLGVLGAVILAHWAAA